MEFASKGIGTAGLTTGIIGTGLGALNALGGGGGILGNLLGIGGNPALYNSDNMPVTRYELGLEQSNAAKDAEIALLKANTYQDQKSLELYKYIDSELRAIRDVQAQQAVHNQRTEDSFVIARQDIAAVKAELSCQIEAERKARCCADNAIVTYANATFYPKMVADVTVGTETTAQVLYNPLPQCGCGCGCGG